MNIIKQWFTLLEANKFDDRRTNDSSKFIAATDKEKLILYDMNNYEQSYRMGFDILVVVDTDKKTIEYPRADIQSYEFADNDEIFTFKNRQLIKINNDLIKFGIIDEKYSLKEYQKSYVSKVKSLSLKEEINFYHGTTKDRLGDIIKFGLRPVDSDIAYSRNRGNASTIPNHTIYNVYLTPNKTLAIQYAKSQSKHRNSSPILCIVKIPDLAKLIPDDDYILNKLYKVSQKYNFSFGYVKDVLSGNDTILYNTIGQKELVDNFIEEINSEYKKLCSELPDNSIISAWNSVAYRGRIPSKFITIEEIKTVNENKLHKLNNFEKKLLELKG